MTTEEAGVPLFDTEHLKEDLRGRSVRGGAVTIVAQGCKFVLGMGSTMVLARLLTPEDYGLIAMVTALTGFLAVFKDLGLSTATVQRAVINHGQISALFWVNVSLSFATMLVTAAMAPLIAWFFAEPRLTNITLVLSIGFLFGGLTVQHQALLQRQMRFATIAKIDISSMVIGIVTGILCAWNGFEYWSLVMMQLAMAVVTASGVWVTCRWLPGLPLRGSGIRPMLAFGSSLTGFSVLNYFSRNFDNILLGRYWGADELGLYNKAYNLLMLPIRQITGPLFSVAMPALSHLQNDPRRYRSYYLKLISLIATITLPFVAFLIVFSKEIVILVLGLPWIASSEIFRALSVAAIVQPIYVTVGLLFVSTGQPGQLLKLTCFATPFFVLSFCVGLHWGGIGVAWCFAIANIVNAVCCYWYASYYTPISVVDICKTVAYPSLVGSIVAAGAMLLRFIFEPTHNPPTMLLMGCVYLGIIFITLNVGIRKNELLITVITNLNRGN